MKRVFYIAILYLGVFGNAQQKPLSEQQLLAMPSDSLRKTIDDIFDDNLETAHLYSKSYLKHSKLIGKKEKIADAYVFLAMSAPPDEVLAYCDSLISATKDFDTHKYPAFAHYMKAETLYGLHQYKEALAAALLANKKITLKTSKYFEYLIKNGIAIMGANNNQHELAVTYFNQSLDYFKAQDNASYLNTLFGLAESHLALKNLDSAAHYINKGLQGSTTENIDFNAFFLMTHGRLLYQQGNYLGAKDSLSKSLPIILEINNLPNLAINAFWLGKSEKKLGNSLSAVRHYKMVDSIFDINKSIPLQLRPAWTGLIAHYNKEEDYQNELKYARKLIVVDSILDEEQGFVTNEITNEFLLPTIEQKNQQERQGLLKAKNKIAIWIVVLAGLLGISAVLFYLYRKRELKRVRDYEQVIKRLKENSTKTKPNNKKLQLKAELIKRIEEGLKLFEKNQDYLKSDTTLIGVSKKIGTNPRYLSQYINHIIRVGFPEYLNNLRIEYVLKRLQKSFVEREDRFRIWSMSDVAKAAGFGSREYYAKAFLKYTNMKHRDYLRQLEKNHKKNRNS